MAPSGPWKWTDERIEALADKLDDWRRIHTNFLLAKFCDEQDIYPQLLSELAHKNERFSEALKAAKAHQEAVLSEGGLMGEHNPSMAIFLLKNVAGYRDKQDIDHTSGGNPIPILSHVQPDNSDTQDTGA